MKRKEAGRGRRGEMREGRAGKSRQEEPAGAWEDKKEKSWTGAGAPKVQRVCGAQHLKVHDVVKVDLASGKIVDSIAFDVGMTCMITKGRNTGRVGTIVSVEKHPGSFDIVAVRDASNHQFATRLSNVFIIGKDDDLQVTLPRGKGVKLSILEERKKRFKDKY